MERLLYESFYEWSLIGNGEGVCGEIVVGKIVLILLNCLRIPGIWHNAGRAELMSGIRL